MVIALVLYVWTVLSFLMGILFGRTMRLPSNVEIPRPSRMENSGLDRAAA